MKKVFVTALVATLVATAPARASVFGQFTPAGTLPVNERLFGAYLTASDNVVGLLGQLRLSFYPGVDFGFQGGLSRVDAGGTKRTTVRLGGDFKVATLRASETRPIDLSIGAALGIETGDDFTTLILGPRAVASRTFGREGGNGVVPYAAVSLAFSSINAGELDQTDFAIPIELGAELRVISGMRLVGEFQFRPGDDINDDVGFALGVNFPF